MDHSAKKILALSNEATECPICHLRFKNNKAFASGCLHCYCYQCIQNWVQRRATCPLCRKPIEYLIKNVKSNNDYDIEEVVPPADDNSDQEGELELSGGSDQESHRNASTASLEYVSDSSDSDIEPSFDEPNASDQKSNEDVFSSMSEHESNGNVSDHEACLDHEYHDYHDTDSEQDWNDFAESEHDYDSEISDHESVEDISSGSADCSEDELNEYDYESSDELISLSATSSVSNQESDLSSENQVSGERSSSVSDLDSDDYFSSSSDY